MTETRARISRSVLMAVCLSAAAALGGCQSGFEGVELQGGVFDMLGISGSSLSAKSKDPQVPARSGIVLPPDQARLPQPGSGGAQQNVAQLPDDVDERRAREAADIDRRHKEFCDNALRTAKARGEDGTVIQGPKGQCNPSILTTFGQSLNNLNQPINTK
jgi:hypothetical protein